MGVSRKVWVSVRSKRVKFTQVNRYRGPRELGRMLPHPYINTEPSLVSSQRWRTSARRITSSFSPSCNIKSTPRNGESGYPLAVNPWLYRGAARRHLKFKFERLASRYHSSSSSSTFYVQLCAGLLEYYGWYRK